MQAGANWSPAGSSLAATNTWRIHERFCDCFLTGADHGAASVEGRTMRRRSVEPAGSRRADLRRGLASPTPTVAAALAGPRLTHNPSRSTVEPENGGYLG